MGLPLGRIDVDGAHSVSTNLQPNPTTRGAAVAKQPYTIPRLLFRLMLKGELAYEWSRKSEREMQSLASLKSDGTAAWHD